MALLKLELFARVLLASGIPVMETVKGTDNAYPHVRINRELSVYLVKDDSYLLHQLMGSAPALSSAQDELCIAIEELRDLIEDYAPAFTRVRLEGNRFQPDFQQMDHAEITAWRLERIGYDWISDEPDISLEEFQEMAQDHWDEEMAAEAECKREALERGEGNGGQDGHIYA
jgi:hypothetical protein